MAQLYLFAIVLLSIPASALAQSGFVRSGGQPIPGATVSITQSGQTLSTVTDQDGHYGFPPVAAGSWSVSVEMFGFDPLKKDVDFVASTGPVNFEVQLKQSQALQRMQQFANRAGGAPGGAAGPGARPGAGLGAGPGGRNRAGNENAEDQELQNELNSQQSSAALPQGAGDNPNESFLVSGSLSPGMAQGAQADSGPDMRFGPGGGLGGPGAPNAPGFGGDQGGAAAQGGGAPGFGGAGGGGGGGFGGGGGGFGGGRGGGGGGFGGGRGGAAGRGQRGRGGQVAGAQFGNRRRGQQGIRGQASFSLQNSALNAEPFSLNGVESPQPAYAQSRFSLIVGGPLVLGKLIKDPKTNFFFTYFGTRQKSPYVYVGNVPTLAERMGDFSQATQAVGSATNQLVKIFNPITQAQFPGNRIPTSLLNPTALALLNNYYPQPNQLANANNFQLESASITNSDNFGFRIQRSITQKDRLSLNLQFQRRNGTSIQPFGYTDDTNGYGLTTQVGWTRNISATVISNFQIRFNRNRSETTPYFASLGDVSPQLGIPGTSSNPLNFGPPSLNFTNFAGLTDGVANVNIRQSEGVTEGLTYIRGLHSFQFGAGFTRAAIAANTDPNGRGTLNFTGLATSAVSGGQVQTGTGYDLADFLLGLPQSSSIQYSANSNYFLQNQWSGYAQDEWKARSNLTLILGIRYEYFEPITEKYGRIANLILAPGATSVSLLTPASLGAPAGLLYPDRNNLSPRLALAWKLPSKKSTLLRAGYGIYYNGQIYNTFIGQLAKQPPFANASAVNTSSSDSLTFQNAFVSPILSQQLTNTYAVDKYFRTPYAGTWNITIQRDFGKGFFAEAGYLGTKGTRLDVRTLPNEPPPGQSLSDQQKSQLGNAVGFTYDQSIGNSIFHALQLRLNRRFNRGISFNAFYQFAKSIDDSSSFGGTGNTTAQNWLDVSAERGLSSFDIRHQFTLGFVWTSPIAGPGSHIASDGKVGRLFKDWQVSGNLTAQTGKPLTARVLGNTVRLAQTGGVGSGRANATGLPIETDGFFNLAAFTVPADGQYGNAGRNTIPGPGMFGLNTAFARSFAITERRRIEFRIEANNILNHVNYSNLYTVVNAVNYGLPSAAGLMRTVQAVVRLRF